VSTYERGRIPFGAPDPDNDYRQNIQIAGGGARSLPASSPEVELDGGGY